MVFLSRVTTAAPTRPPIGLPAPPTMAIIRYSMPISGSNGVGLMKRLMWA